MVIEQIGSTCRVTGIETYQAMKLVSRLAYDWIQFDFDHTVDGIVINVFRTSTMVVTDLVAEL